MSHAKKSIKEYFFVTIFSVAMGIVLINIGEFFANKTVESFWDLISKALSVTVFSGLLSIVLLPILSWYTIYKKDVKLGEYISGLCGGTIFNIVLGIILIIIGTTLEGFEWRIGFLAWIFKIIGFYGFNLTGHLIIIFSPIVSWYYEVSEIAV